MLPGKTRGFVGNLVNLKALFCTVPAQGIRGMIKDMSR